MDANQLVALRLDGVKASCERSRLAWFIALISAVTVVIALYNDELAWSNHLLDDNSGLAEVSPSRDPTVPPSHVICSDCSLRDDPRALRAARKIQIAKNVEDNSNITIGLFGLRLSSSDLTFFGSFAMLVVSMYYCLCSRRAYQDIGSLLQDSLQSEKPVREYVLAGIKQSLVFTKAVEANVALSDSHGIESPRLLNLIRSLFSIFTYSPTFAIAAIIATDVDYAFFQGSELFPDHLWWLLHLRPAYRVQFILLDVLAIVLLILVLCVNRLTNRFQNGTTMAIQRFVKDTSEPS